MKVISIAFGCALAAALLSPAAHAQECGLKRFASLDILSDPTDRVVIAVTMDGTDRKVLVDTGGLYPAVASKVVDELKLKTVGITPQMEIYTSAGKSITDYVIMPELGIGPNKVRNLPMMVQPEGMLEEPLDGMLGPDFLSQFDLDFDFAAKKLNLFSPDHCDGKVVYWAPAYAAIPFTIYRDHVVVDVVLDGKDVKGIVDTGSSYTLIGSSAAKRLFGADALFEGVEKMPGARPDSLVQSGHRFQQLTIGGISVSNPLVAIYPDNADKAFWHSHTDMVDKDPIYGAGGLQMEPITLGLSVLSKLHVYIAFKEHKIYVTPANAAWPATASSSH